MQDFCRNCGVSVDTEQTFCERCGSDLREQRVESDPTLGIGYTAPSLERTGTKGKKKNKAKNGGNTALIVLTVVFAVLALSAGAFAVVQTLQLNAVNSQLEKAGLDAENVQFTVNQINEEKSGLEADNERLNNTVTEQESLIATQYDTITAQEQTLAAYEQTISEQDETISDLNEEIEELEDEMDIMSDDIKLFNKVMDFLQEPDCGYAAKNFRAFRPVYVMHLDDDPASFTLTADFAGAVTISFEQSGTAADCYFTESSYSVDTPVEVCPMHKGITYLTFSNTVNDLTFRVMIVVVD